jgi:hypothetical protein
MIDELIRETTFVNGSEIIPELGKGRMGKVHRVEDNKSQQNFSILEREIPREQNPIFMKGFFATHWRLMRLRYYGKNSSQEA